MVRETNIFGMLSHLFYAYSFLAVTYGYLFIRVPYSIMKYFALQKFRGDKMEYVYENLGIISDVNMPHLETHEVEELDRIVASLKNMSRDSSKSEVRKKVQQACDATPDWILYLISTLTSPISAHILLFGCVKFGDEYFLGFFLLIGCLLAGPTIHEVIHRIIAQKKKDEKAEIQYHTEKLLKFLKR